MAPIRIARGYAELGRTEWPLAVRQAVAERAAHIRQARVWIVLQREMLRRARRRHGA